jgi:hypothetical protein
VVRRWLWVVVAVAWTLVIASRPRAQDSKTPVADPFADGSEAGPDAGAAANDKAKAKGGFDPDFVPDGYVVTPEGHLGLLDVGHWPAFDRSSISVCAFLVIAGSSPKKSIDEWEKNRKSLFTSLHRDAATLTGHQRDEAPKVMADAVMAFRDACKRGAGALAAGTCAHVKLVGGVPVLSYVVGHGGWCGVRDGTGKDLQKWIRQAATEAERLSRIENLKTLNACGKLAAQKIDWDYVPPKRSEFAGCTIEGQGDDDSFPE